MYSTAGVTESLIKAWVPGYSLFYNLHCIAYIYHAIGVLNYLARFLLFCYSVILLFKRRRTDLNRRPPG